MNVQEVKRYMYMFDKMPGYHEFYIALLLWDVKGLPPEKVDEKLVNEMEDLLGNVNTIYDENLRLDVWGCE